MRRHLKKLIRIASLLETASSFLDRQADRDISPGALLVFDSEMSLSSLLLLARSSAGALGRGDRRLPVALAPLSTFVGRFLSIRMGHRVLHQESVMWKLVMRTQISTTW